MIIKLLVSALAIYLTAALLPGVTVKSYWYSIGIAIVLTLLNALVKPLLLLISLPVTVLTFGLFVWVIDAVIILLCSKFLSGFKVNGFWWALVFSLISTVLFQLIYWLL